MLVIAAGPEPVEPTRVVLTPEAYAEAVERLVRAQSVGASILSNASLALKALRTAAHE